MPNPKTQNKSPINRNIQSSMSPIRQFSNNIDNAAGVSNAIGNGLLTASPLVARQPSASDTRNGLRSS